MDPSFRSNVSGDFFQNDAWVEDSLPPNLPADPSKQYNLCNPPQIIFDLAPSNTTTHTTPLSVSGSTLICTPVSSLGAMTPFQDENTRTQEKAATDYWRSGAYEFSGTDGGGFSPATTFDGRNTTVRTNEGIGYKRPTSPSQVVKVDDYPDLTSIGTWTHPLKSLNEEGLGNSWLSQQKRLPIELRNRAHGWHCPICNQRFKRRDYIKPHVKRKHPECYGGLYCTPSSSPERSVAAPSNYPSTHEDLLVSGLHEGEKRPPLMVFWDSQLNNHTTDSSQSDGAFPGGGITPQKRSLDLTSPDGRDILDGSENESCSRLKTSYDNCARSLACPFYKHYPFQHRKCLALSLRRPKDVKQHIYRSHTQPEFYCARCYHIFHTATERDSHWRDKLCDRLDSLMLPKFQGITKDQKEMLIEKSPRELSVEAQWFQIYAIIFPLSEFPRSPFVGNCLEEMVPLLREKWETHGCKITARAVGDLDHHQLSFAMDLFFRSLEGETFEHETGDNWIRAASAQSHMGDDIQLDTWSFFPV